MKPEQLVAEKRLETSELPFVLLDYQRKLLESTAAHAVTVSEKSRRIGATWAIAADAVLTAGAQRTAGGMDVLYIGFNLDMTKEFVDTAASWAKAFSYAAGAVDEFLFEDDVEGTGDTRKIRAFRITFASGFEIVALSSRPRSLRGRQGYVIIDEAAFHDELEELLKAALALLIWGGKVLIISTHNGADNPFAGLINDIHAKRKPYNLVRTTFDDALADGLYRRICFVSGKEWTPAAEAEWRKGIVALYGEGADEELFCIPRAGSGVFLPSVLVESRMIDVPVLRWHPNDAFAQAPDHLREADALDWCEQNLKPLLEALDRNLRSGYGFDFGRTGDLSVLWPFQVMPNLVRRPPFLLEMRNVPFRQQEQLHNYVVDRLPRFQFGALDARGNGQYMAERAMQRYGSGRIAQVMLSVEWYRENMPVYKAAIEDALWQIPRHADVLTDHRAIVMERGVAQVPASYRGKGSDGGQRHGDSAIAGALANFASRQEGAEFGYTPVPRSRPFDEGGAHDRDRDSGSLRGTRGTY